MTYPTKIQPSVKSSLSEPPKDIPIVSNRTEDPTKVKEVPVNLQNKNQHSQTKSSKSGKELRNQNAAFAPHPTYSDHSAPPNIARAVNDYDLSVTYIERNPKYERYKVSYFTDQTCGPYPFKTDRGPQALNANSKMYPSEGEKVTFSAHILNQGAKDSPPVQFQWHIDGLMVKSGTIPGIKSGNERVENLEWNWRSGKHTIRFAVNCNDVFKQNNQLEDRIDGWFLQILVDRPLYERFAKMKNLVGTYSFEDWLKAQSAQMNEIFKRSKYDIVAPNGIEAGFRIDRIVVVEKGQEFPRNFAFDGEWRFRDDPAWPQAQIHRIDEGLLHEWGHQLGLPDLYQMNVVWERNLIRDPAGNRYLKELMQANPGLMGGGSILPHKSGAIYFSSHSATALNLHKNQRCGFFGDYVWDTPKITKVRLLDNSGTPLANAKVFAYQFNQDTTLAKQRIGIGCFFFDEPPIWVMNTDRNGILTVPNQKAPIKGPTARGHKLRDNPYGDLDVGTNNGVLILKIEANEKVDLVGLYCWQLNLEYWKGNRDIALIPLQTKIGSGNTGWEGRKLAVNPGVSTALLSFDSVDHADDYSLYYGKAPNPIKYAHPIKNCVPRIELRDLQPGTTYYYQITANAGTEIHPVAFEGSFVTRK